MNDKIRIELSRLDADISKLESAASGFANDAKAGYDAMKSLGGSWEGPAHDIFDAQLEIDFQTLSALESALQHMIECLKIARQEYSKCENEAYSAANALRV